MCSGIHSKDAGQQSARVNHHVRTHPDNREVTLRDLQATSHRIDFISITTGELIGPLISLVGTASRSAAKVNHAMMTNLVCGHKDRESTRLNSSHRT